MGWPDAKRWLVASLLAGLLCAGLAGQTTPAASTSTSGSTSAAQPKPYVFAITALANGGVPAGDLPFLTKLPRLILGQLQVLSPRYEDKNYRAELAKRNLLAARFDKGNDLYKKLGDAGSLQLDPTLSAWDRPTRLKAASDAVAKANDALSGVDEAFSQASQDQGLPPAFLPPRIVQAWDGKGLLFDLGKDNAVRAGRKQSVDLVITGSANPLGSYLEVRLEGWDSAIGKKVFAWDEFASADDPEPLAKVFARRIGDWLSSTPIARFDLAVNPASSRILVDGKPVDASNLVLFSPENRAISIAAWAPGFKEDDRDILLVTGEDRGLTLDLHPQSYGRATLRLDPPSATILVGGLEADPAKPIDLGGLRDILIASAPDYETKMQVLPAQGSSMIDVRLRPSDGLGPGKRTDKAKDDFYLALGLAAIGFPLVSIAQGYQTIYAEADLRQGYYGVNQSFTTGESISTAAYWTAVAGTAAAVTWTVTKLVALLGGMSQE